MNANNLTTREIPSVGAPQIQLLERLCNTVAVSGDEGEVRRIVLEEIEGFVDEVKVDALGNVLAIRRGSAENRVRVMLSAHMDEVGFMIVDADKDGWFRFEIVGNMDVRQVAGKPVWIGRDRIPGVIGARPIHLTKSEDRERTLTVENLRIDVGLEPGGKVKVGDWATFATPFRQVGPSIMAKAIDDRIGVVNLIEIIRHAPANIDLLAAFTVQEEVGLRGAQVAGYAFNPDLAIAVDSTPANDLPLWDGSENTVYNTRLDAGPAIYVADGRTLSDPRLVRFLTETAESYGIPYQFRQPGLGGTDAGAVHKQRAGIPSISVSVPGRYAHSAIMLARLADWENTLSLLAHALQRVSPDLLKQDRI